MFKKTINLNYINNNIKYPDFLKEQIRSFKEFLDLKTTNKKKKLLFKVLNNIFPIYNKKKNYIIKFINYYIDPP
ncbi:MAG: hypothetical protein NHG11_00010 [Candidatus Shikimatogenerans bostrichidophilus]|nr:MAG: hypothetical protein NHG11_00010 [Candidatus Shikimatogenerans bostrichidophilus]